MASTRDPCELVLANARHWIEEFHIDGLRLDAAQSIFDQSPSHIIAEIAATVRATAGRRGAIVIGENEPQHAQLLRSRSEGGQGLDALWNDDFHHAAVVALTGRDEAYYSDYRGRPQEFVSAAKHGFLYQGQEFASSAPFLYFADHEGELADRVREGRAEFLEQFPSIALPDVAESLPDPADRRTFERCKLDHSERERHARAFALHRDLIRLRRTDAAFAARRAGDVDGAVLSDSAFLLRFRSATGHEDRLLVVNLGRPLHFDPAPEPLLAPPERRRWSVIWSSDNPRYGGLGAPPVERDSGVWHIPGESATVLAPAANDTDA